jgi:hypothetical protein
MIIFGYANWAENGFRTVVVSLKPSRQFAPAPWSACGVNMFVFTNAKTLPTIAFSIPKFS